MLRIPLRKGNQAPLVTVETIVGDGHEVVPEMQPLHVEALQPALAAADPEHCLGIEHHWQWRPIDRVLEDSGSAAQRSEHAERPGEPRIKETSIPRIAATALVHKVASSAVPTGDRAELDHVAAPLAAVAYGSEVKVALQVAVHVVRIITVTHILHRPAFFLQRWKRTCSPKVDPSGDTSPLLA
jgi:hypothetical protein